MGPQGRLLGPIFCKRTSLRGSESTEMPSYGRVHARVLVRLAVKAGLTDWGAAHLRRAGQPRRYRQILTPGPGRDVNSPAGTWGPDTNPLDTAGKLSKRSREENGSAKLPSERKILRDDSNTSTFLIQLNVAKKCRKS